MSYILCPKCGEGVGVVGTTVFQCRCAREAALAKQTPAGREPGRDDYNELFVLAKQRVEIVQRIMKLGYIKQTRDTEEGEIRFVGRDDVISVIHNVAKVSRAKDCGPHPDDNKKIAGAAPGAAREGASE